MAGPVASSEKTLWPNKQQWSAAQLLRLEVHTIVLFFPPPCRGPSPSLWIPWTCTPGVNMQAFIMGSPFQGTWTKTVPGESPKVSK